MEGVGSHHLDHIRQTTDSLKCLMNKPVYENQFFATLPVMLTQHCFILDWVKLGLVTIKKNIPLTVTANEWKSSQFKKKKNNFERPSESQKNYNARPFKHFLKVQEKKWSRAWDFCTKSIQGAWRNRHAISGRLISNDAYSMWSLMFCTVSLFLPSSLFSFILSGDLV